jgi:acyl carrier protein
MTDLEIKIKAIVTKTLGVDESEITENVNFIEDLGADSLDIVEMIMETEQCFGISIPDDQIDNLTTFNKLVEFIKTANPLN